MLNLINRPLPPKRPKGAFILFFIDNKDKLKEMKLAEKAKHLAKAWNSNSVNKRKYF